MKKIKTAVIIAALLVTTPLITNAIQTQNINEQQAINKNTSEQVQTLSKSAEQAAVDKVNILTERYMNNLRECVPFHWSQDLDMFGLKASFKIDINGWVDNKCSYNLTGKIGGLGKDVREVFEIPISDEAISKIEPIVQCNFTREQLNILVDAIIARNERNSEQIEKLLENPQADISSYQKPKLTPQEEKLVQMIVEGKACTILNKDELMQNFTQLMDL